MAKGIRQPAVARLYRPPPATQPGAHPRACHAPTGTQSRRRPGACPRAQLAPTGRPPCAACRGTRLAMCRFAANQAKIIWPRHTQATRGGRRAARTHLSFSFRTVAEIDHPGNLREQQEDRKGHGCEAWHHGCCMRVGGKRALRRCFLFCVLKMWESPKAV